MHKKVGRCRETQAGKLEEETRYTAFAGELEEETRYTAFAGELEEETRCTAFAVRR